MAAVPQRNSGLLGLQKHTLVMQLMTHHMACGQWGPVSGDPLPGSRGH